MKRILISHSWTSPEGHTDITRLLRERGYEFIDRSVLPLEPLSARSEAHLKRQLSRRISEVSTVLLAATEDAHRKPMIQFEIEEAVRQKKRLIAVKPLGLADAPVPKLIVENAHAIVSFRSADIIQGIEGEDIRSRSAYVIAETDDVHRAAHQAARIAATLLIVGALTQEKWVPAAGAILRDNGYCLVQEGPLASQQEVLQNMLIFALAGLALGFLMKGRWPATLSLGGAAAAGIWTVGSKLRVEKQYLDYF